MDHDFNSEIEYLDTNQFQMSDASESPNTLINVVNVPIDNPTEGQIEASLLEEIQNESSCSESKSSNQSNNDSDDEEQENMFYLHSTERAEENRSLSTIIQPPLESNILQEITYLKEENKIMLTKINVLNENQAAMLMLLNKINDKLQPINRIIEKDYTFKPPQKIKSEEDLMNFNDMLKKKDYLDQMVRRT